MGTFNKYVPSPSITFPPSSISYFSNIGNPLLSENMVCRIALISPGPETNSQRLPVLFFGLQPTFNASSSVVEIIDPMNIEVGCILIFACFVKSKSTLVIPI